MEAMEDTVAVATMEILAESGIPVLIIHLMDNTSIQIKIIIQINKV